MSTTDGTLNNVTNINQKLQVYRAIGWDSKHILTLDFDMKMIQIYDIIKDQWL